jgi:hypothetical protein
MGVEPAGNSPPEFWDPIATDLLGKARIVKELRIRIEQFLG